MCCAFCIFVKNSISRLGEYYIRNLRRFYKIRQRILNVIYTKMCHGTAEWLELLGLVELVKQQ